MFGRDAVEYGMCADAMDLQGIEVKTVAWLEGRKFRQHRPGHMAVEDQRAAAVHKRLDPVRQRAEETLVQVRWRKCAI